MIGTRRIPHIARVTLVGALLLIIPSNASSEVGVYHDFAQGPEPHGPYEISIIDDIDPVPTVWGQFSPPGSGRVVLNPEGEVNGDGRPATLFNTVSKLPTVVWAKNSPAGFDIVVSWFTGGQWSVPQLVAASSSDEVDPFVIQDPADGRVHLLYGVDDPQHRIMYTWAPADLSSFSVPVQVSEVGDVALRPSATFHEGQLLVAYESHGTSLGSTPRHIVLATENYSEFDYEVLGQTHFDGENWPQVHSAVGKIWVDWIDETGAMTWVRKEGGNPWEPPAEETFGTVEERDYHVRGAIRYQALD